VHLEYFSLNFSSLSFEIRVNLLHPFSFMVCFFQFKGNFARDQNNSKYREWASLNCHRIPPYYTITEIRLSPSVLCSLMIVARIWIFAPKKQPFRKVRARHHHRIILVMVWHYRDPKWREISMTYSYLSALLKMKLWIPDPCWDLNWYSPPQSDLGLRSQGTAGQRIPLRQSVGRCDCCSGQCFL